MGLRRILIGLGAAFGSVVILAAIVLGVLVWRFDPNAYKPRIEASVRDATGLTVKLNGPIGLAWALHPTITLADVTVQNPPGFTGPDLAKITSVAVQLDLPALIHRQVVVQSITLDHPQIALERNAKGQANWDISRPAPAQPAAAHPSPASPAAAARPLPFAIDDLRIHDLALQYRDDRTGAVSAASVPLAEVTSASAQSPTKLLAQGSVSGVAFDVAGQAAPLGQLLDGRPYPVSANAKITGKDANLALAVAAPAANQPAHLTLSGQYRAQPVSLTADLGKAGAATGADLPLAVRLAGQAAGSSLAVDGSIGDPAKLTGVDLALNAQSADLAKLGALFGMRLPELRALKVSGRLQDRNGLSQGVAISKLALASAEGDAAGTIAMTFAPRPTLTADLHGARLDLAAFRTPAPPAQSAPAPGGPTKAPPPKAPAAAGHLIPDTPLPVDALRQEDADLALRFDSVQAQDVAFKDVRADVHLHNGMLAAKLRGVFEGGATDLDATVDARGATPAVAIALSAPALPAGQVLGALGAPALISGHLALGANLKGAGATPHLIAATLSGFARLNMRDGSIATTVLEKMLGPAIARANPLALVAHGDATRLRCFVVDAKATNGQVRIDPLLLSSDLLTVSGDGSVNLASETLDLHVRPQGRAGSIELSVPMTISGSLRDPHAAVGKDAPAAALLGALRGIESGVAGSGCGGSAAPAARPALPVPKIGNTPLPDAGALLRQFLR